MVDRWIYLPINPEPWAVGELSLGRKNGKLFPKMSPNKQLQAYQDAVREALEDQDMLPVGQYSLTFYFWRLRSQYQGRTRRVRKHQVDATNMQKALEDALQGMLFDNDRNVQDIHSVIVGQGPDINPKILIRASLARQVELPREALDAIIAGQKSEPEFDNTWDALHDGF